jgi:hypothetical protein
MLPDAVPPGEKVPDIRFNPESHEFKTANAVQKRDPRWIAVAAMLRDGAQFRELVRPLELGQDEEDEWTDVLSSAAARIRNYMVPVQTIHVDDYETVAEIFNRVNTGGTKLSKGDLVLGSMAARWTAGRETIEGFEAQMRATGWAVNREVLLRITSVLMLGSPNHIRLLDLTSEAEWVEGWDKTRSAVTQAIDFLRGDAGIPTSSLLPSVYALLLPAVYMHDFRGNFTPTGAQELARWVYVASAFGHYSGSLETTLASDINLLRTEGASDTDELLAGLIQAAQAPRTAGARLTAQDIEGKGMRSPLLKLLQLRAIQCGAQSWLSNRAINFDPQHNGLAVEVHHIFPKAWLAKHDLAQHPERDSVANFAFLSKWDNIRIGADDPASYLAAADPEVLRAQWIPLDEELWATNRFDEFLAARRALLAAALNDMLGLGVDASSDEPLEADETPEPEVGAWSEVVSEVAA